MASRGAVARRGLPAPGLTMVVPGAPQWLWGQRERALLLAGSFASALAAGAFSWGTAAGMALLAFAYIVHVTSVADAIRQWSFPGFGPRVPTVAASAGLGVVYGPLAVVAALMAWPGFEPGGPSQGYLVDRLAYRDRSPAPGQHVWLAPAPGESRGRLGSVLGRPGDEVEWTGRQLRVANRRSPLIPFRPGMAPPGLSFRVPEDHLLVSYRTGDPLLPETWELIATSRVEGRAWAKLYPVWERRLLN